VAPDRITTRIVERVERCCADHAAERPMRIAIADELRRHVSFGSYVWALTDPETEVAIAPLADVPERVMPQLPRLIRLRYLTPVNRWTNLAGTADSLVRATGGDVTRSLFHREVLAGCGIGDLATVVFRDAHGLWGWLELWRGADDDPFSDEELDRLAAIAPVVTAAVRRAQGSTFSLPADVPDRTGPVVLVLSPDLDVHAQTPYTDEYLRQLLPPDGDRQPVPAGAYNVAAQLLAIEAGVDDRPPKSRVHLRDGVWLTFRAARIESPDGGTEADIAVSIEVAAPAERRDLFARAHALTRRETEVLAHLVDGADTRTLAETLFVSEHTVQDHLKSIFAKTDARNRRTLLARVTGA
jgi:DNA-binding CsgD family transcriptional regulator